MVEVYVGIGGTGRSKGDLVLSNRDLWRRFPSIRQNFDVEEERRKQEADAGILPEEVFDGWTKRVSGIERRWYNTTRSTEEMAAEAGLIACEEAGIRPKDLDFIWVGTFTPFYHLDNAGSRVQDIMGARGVPASIFSNACASFPYGLRFAYDSIRAGTGKNILVICAETLSKLSDLEDPRSAILWADGAGAAVLTASEEPGLFTEPYLESFHNANNIVLRNPSMLRDILRLEERLIELPGTKIEMNGSEVFKEAVKSFARGVFAALLYYRSYRLGNLEEARQYMKENRERFADGTRSDLLDEFKRLGLNRELEVLLGINLKFFFHQANSRIEDAAGKLLGIPDSAFYRSIAIYGNTSGASIPMGLDKARKEGTVKKGQIVYGGGVGGCYPNGGVILRL